MELNELRLKINKMNHLKELLKDLNKQKEELNHKIYALKFMMDKEIKDVERLDGISISALLLKFSKDKEEKIQKEKREAYEAELKYNTACNEYHYIESKIEEYTKEIKELSLLKEEYHKLIEEKKNTIYDEYVQELEEQLILYKSQKKETQEAITVIGRVLSDCDNVMSELNKAEGWGTFDIAGGGMLTAMIKHNTLDKAQDYVEDLQVSLRKLKTELSDIHIYSNIDVRIDGFLSIADYMFDGLFVDWMILDHIRSSKREIENIQDKMYNLKNKLNQLIEDLTKKEFQVQDNIEGYIVEKTI